MKLEKVLPFARKLLELAVKPGDIAVDATVGNGNDTIFSANLAGPSGRIYGFDIQDQALMTSKTKLREHKLQDQVTLFHTGHENISEYIPPLHFGKITAAVFNLGYLPGGDKNIVTVHEKTIMAIDQLLEIMAPEGIIVIVVYHGHPEGKVEREYLLRYVKSLDQNTAHVLEYKFLNQKNNPPFIIAIEKI
ncbi:class I SAM-dependent methyltransferase [Mesobacillus subterraneus]|uniref:rRNA methyltransferase n=1 Tax=Mesobacillus subterraneus TaxID=285983 RepID=A0A0D6ZB96_9BACI|nr:class I SAM-dependent methyltransferase [Mesobacillus subterraneus]KIY22620.1 rRNA methyltransferase [Mesobacillus subterraneus]